MSDRQLPARRGARILVAALVIVDFVLLLFPPLTWWLGSGAVWFFVVTGAIATASLFVMYAVERTTGEA